MKISGMYYTKFYLIEFLFIGIDLVFYGYLKRRDLILPDLYLTGFYHLLVIARYYDPFS